MYGKSEKNLRRPLALALVACALLPRLASATLGEAETTVQTDGAKLRGTIKSVDRSAYRVHDIQLGSGTLVREFVGLDGIGFAVSWRGPAMPDLRQTLGRYFDTLTTAVPDQASRTHLSIKQSEVVVEAAGHMRAFSGRAYLPYALPSGVTLGDLR